MSELPHHSIREVLEIAKPYHKSFGGSEHCMCYSISLAVRDKLISEIPAQKAALFCEELVKEVSLTGPFDLSYLKSALYHSTNIKEQDTFHTMALIWDAVIDKLKADNK